MNENLTSELSKEREDHARTRQELELSKQVIEQLEQKSKKQPELSSSSNRNSADGSQSAELWSQLQEERKKIQTIGMLVSQIRSIQPLQYTYDSIYCPSCCLWFFRSRSRRVISSHFIILVYTTRSPKFKRSKMHTKRRRKYWRKNVKRRQQTSRPLRSSRRGSRTLSKPNPAHYSSWALGHLQPLLEEMKDHPAMLQ